MGWNFFKNDKEEESEEQILGRQIDEALQKVMQEKRDAESMLRKIDGWMRDAIVETYADFFENAQYSYYKDKHKATALEKYPELKQKHGSKLPAETYERCEKIVNGYMNQLEMTKSKIALYDKMTKEYQTSKQKLRDTVAKGVKTDKLEQHEQRLEQLDSNAETLGNAYVATNKLEDIKRELELRQQTMAELEKLSAEYNGSESNFDSSKQYKDEIDKMLNNI